MAGTAIEINVKVDDREIGAALDRLQAHTDRMAPAYKNIGEELLQSTRQRFRDQVDPDDRPWQALRASTLAAKAARGHSLSILRARGHLADTIRYQADDSGVRVGTNRIYGAIHQMGGTTSPHVIRPKTKKALAWPGGRHPVRSVNHPGSAIPARRPFIPFPFANAVCHDRNMLNFNEKIRIFFA